VDIRILKATRSVDEKGWSWWVYRNKERAIDRMQIKQVSF